MLGLKDSSVNVQTSHHNKQFVTLGFHPQLGQKHARLPSQGQATQSEICYQTFQCLKNAQTFVTSHAVFCSDPQKSVTSVQGEGTLLACCCNSRETERGRHVETQIEPTTNKTLKGTKWVYVKLIFDLAGYTWFPLMALAAPTLALSSLKLAAVFWHDFWNTLYLWGDWGERHRVWIHFSLSAAWEEKTDPGQEPWWLSLDLRRLLAHVQLQKWNGSLMMVFRLMWRQVYAHLQLLDSPHESQYKYLCCTWLGDTLRMHLPTALTHYCC